MVPPQRSFIERIRHGQRLKKHKKRYRKVGKKSIQAIEGEIIEQMRKGTPPHLIPMEVKGQTNMSLDLIERKFEEIKLKMQGMGKKRK